ncbi:P-loop containing nucleoside triphosphate hydrolase protein [Melanogaster broomeanus]|nr:P-loop containing nucleoside triphosphate hydrolase protein [Melanogaster broomeanus]
MADPHFVDIKSTFSSFSHLLDARILRALADMGFARPTLVQAKTIQIALENCDILARARTGSGKTAAYCIPVIQKILNAKSNLSSVDPSYQTTRALILVPTRELAEQVNTSLENLLAYCDKEVAISNVASGTASHLQRTLLAEKPDIVIATPSRALGLLQSKTLSLLFLESLVIDEADLILSYGHDEDVRQIFGGGHFPKVYQSFLMSATMTDDVETLKGLALRNPAILKLEEDEDEAALLTQYSVRCSEVDKFLLTYVILKLHLIKGKCILFVNDVDRCYRLKLFLEQFSIKSCVLNSELPLNSRYHTVQEFNKGVYDYIIATDESGGKTELDTDDELDDEEELEQQARDGDADQKDDMTPSQPKTVVAMSGPEVRSTSSQKRKRSPSPQPGPAKSLKRKHKKSSDKEYGVTRGVDFVDVACVLNFDLPSSSRSYTHRVGQDGTCRSYGHVPLFRARKGMNIVFAKIDREQAARGSKIKEYKFDIRQVEAFRYRMEDALRSVTAERYQGGQNKRTENGDSQFNSEKLKAHFEDNPLDLEYLRHDKPLHPMRIQAHMKHVPTVSLTSHRPSRRHRRR